MVDVWRLQIEKMDSLLEKKGIVLDSPTRTGSARRRRKIAEVPKSPRQTYRLKNLLARVETLSPRELHTSTGLPSSENSDEPPPLPPDDSPPVSPRTPPIAPVTPIAPPAPVTPIAPPAPVAPIAPTAPVAPIAPPVPVEVMEFPRIQCSSGSLVAHLGSVQLKKADKTSKPRPPQLSSLSETLTSSLQNMRRAHESSDEESEDEGCSWDSDEDY